MKPSRLLRLVARYLDNPRAIRVKRLNGTPETYWKLDHPWFHKLGIRSVIDVGANEGQFAITARCLLPDAEIYSFEPIPECAARTRKKFGSDQRFNLLECALGDRVGTASFSVSSVTGASSLLQMSNIQSKYFPESLEHKDIMVPLDTLDNVMGGKTLLSPYLLKIDVQGFEFQVLAGGKRTLAGAVLALIEASYEPFYKEQKLFCEIYDVMRENGFSFYESFNMMYDSESGHALQGDFLFVREI